MIALGIDIGGMSVKASAVENGRPIWTGQSHFYLKPSTNELCEAIRVAVAGRLLDDAHGRPSRIGLCVPGLIDPSNRVITLAVNVPGLVGIPLDRLVPDALGIAFDRPATILNDAAATAIDLHQKYQIRGRLLALTLGTGVGAAVLDDGKPLVVEGKSPGHIGQIDVSIAGHPVIGPDGGAGGLEGYIGAEALRQTAGPDVSAALATFTGDEPSMRALVRAIRIAHAIYRPDHICLAGGIGIRLGQLLPVLRQKIEQNLTSLARPGWILTAGDDDFHAARGAARNAIDRMGIAPK